MTAAGKLPALVWCAWFCSTWLVVSRSVGDDDAGSEPSSAAVEDEGDAVSQDAAGEAFDWSVVQDRTPISARESELYYSLLAKASRSEIRELQNEAEEFRRERWVIDGEPRNKPLDQYSSFVDVVLHPEPYRGVPITLHGHTQDILVSPAGTNEHGIETLYEAWLYTPDSQQIPTVVIFTELPDGLETGRQMIDGVSVTGFFLKHHAYRAQDGKLHFAPLLLAQRLEWDPPAQGSSLPNWLIGIGAALPVLLVFWVWSTSRHDRKLSRQHLQEETGPVDLSGLSVDE